MDDAKVLEYLRSHKIEAEPVCYGRPLGLESWPEGIDPLLCVQSLVTREKGEIVTYLFPVNQIFNLERWREDPDASTFLNRYFESDTTEDPYRPSVPGFTLGKTRIDESLKDRERWYCFSGSPSRLIELGGAQVRMLSRHAEAQYGSWSLTPEAASRELAPSLKRYSPEEVSALFGVERELPVLSSTARKLMALQSDPDADAHRLSLLVLESPTLTAQVLRWANAPLYGFPGGVDNVHDAVLKVLGFDLVMNMAIGLAIAHRFKIVTSGPLGLRAYWKHSLSTAVLIERLLRRCKAPDLPAPGIAYLSGLLHNFGLLLSGDLFPEHFEYLQKLFITNPHQPIHFLEQCVLGFNHATLGEWIMKAWHMPKVLTEATLFHHQELSGEQKLLMLIELSITLLRQKKLGEGRLSYDADVFEILHISLEEVEEIYEEVSDTPWIDEIVSEILSLSI